MPERLQDGFNEKDFEILLKYDGERNQKRYTVVLIPQQMRENTVREDTNDIEKTTIEMVEGSHVDVSKEACEAMLEMFKMISGSVIKKFGEEEVFSFSIAKKEELEYSLYYSGRFADRFSSASFEEMLHHLDTEGIL